MQDVLIKDLKGNKVPLKAYEEDGAIVLSKKLDKSPDDLRRTVKLYCIDRDKLEAFRSIRVTVEEEKSILGDFLYNLVNSLKRVYSFFF